MGLLILRGGSRTDRSGTSYTMVVGKPPFQTKDIKAIYKKIKHLEYSFPSNVEISDAAMDLVEAILDREPQNRPSTCEILQHDFTSRGTFPRSVPPTAMDIAPDFSSISPAQSARNFAYVQKVCGASVVAAQATVSTVPEEDGFSIAGQGPPEPPAQVVALSNGKSVIAQEVAIEREVKKVLEPHSPISELLKSASKPLMVSPRALAAQREREKNEIARRAVAASASASRLDRESEKENEPPRDSAARRVTRSQDKQSKPEKAESEAETGLEGAIRALKVTSGGVVSPTRATGRDKRKTASAGSSITVAREAEPVGKAIRSAREVYQACFDTLEDTIGSRRGSLQLEEPEDVRSPQVFITAWIDYTHKYGTAYQLTDGSAGVYFNDSTSMILSPNHQSVRILKQL